MSDKAPIVVQVHQVLAAAWPEGLQCSEVAAKVRCTLRQARSAVSALKRSELVEPIARADVTDGFAWRLSL